MAAKPLMCESKPTERERAREEAEKGGSDALRVDLATTIVPALAHYRGQLAAAVRLHIRQKPF